MGHGKDGVFIPGPVIAFQEIFLSDSFLLYVYTYYVQYIHIYIVVYIYIYQDIIMCNICPRLFVIWVCVKLKAPLETESKHQNIPS